MNQLKREIKIYENHFSLFYATLPKDVQEKFVYVFRVIKSIERVSEKFLKHIQGEKGLYEIRVEVGSNIYRAF
ncbi:MAG: type II toxin-antitoxin system RelE/ParE family toxin [Emticicia sp.]|nr:type II toxin-antitoxin system RelE/ParE family toxin [Emticicia sp.]